MNVCLKCGNEWEPRIASPKRCPSCCQPKWWEPRRNKLQALKTPSSRVIEVKPEVAERRREQGCVDIPGVTRGFPEPIEDEDVPGPEMCPHKEWSGELGEHVKCGMAVHGPKVKHGNWVKAD